jgi:hypothetical protein
VAGGTITVNSNSVHADDTYSSAGQFVNVDGVSGSASVGSTEGLKATTVGAKFTATGSLDNMNQFTSTGASADASQSGTVNGVLGSIWGNATAGDGDQSWTAGNTVVGSITVNNNNVHADDTYSSAGQFVNVDGVSGGSASVGSSNSTYYAKVGSGFNNFGEINMMTQQTNTMASPGATQTGTVFTLGNTLGDAWTRTEAGDTSNNRQVYVETKAKRQLGYGSPTITVSSAAYGSLGNTTAYESKQRSEGRSTTYAFAKNATALPVVTNDNAKTNAFAWANLTDKGRTITTF